MKSAESGAGTDVQRREGTLPIQHRIGGSSLADDLGDELADTLPTAQPKTETGLDTPPGGRSIPFGPAPIQGKDLAAAALSGFGAAQAKPDDIAEETPDPSAQPAQAEGLEPQVSDAPPGGGSSGGPPAGSAPSGDPFQAKGDVEGGGDLPTSGGAPLAEDVRADMENAFASDFSTVRVHVSDKVAKMGALALTQGSHIYFAPGKYDPATKSGRELLGHEMTHVVQQAGGSVSATKVVDGVPVNDDTSLESEADALGAKAASGQSASVAGAGGGVQGKFAAQAKLAQARGSGTRTLRKALEEKEGDAYRWPSARIKWRQLQYEATLYPRLAAVVPEFEKQVDKSLADTDASDDPQWPHMANVSKQEQFLFRGNPLKLADIVGEKGVARSIRVDDAWTSVAFGDPSLDMLKPAARDRIGKAMSTATGKPTEPPWSLAKEFAWGANRLSGFFDDKRDLRPDGMLSGRSGFGWWSSVAQTGSIEERIDVQTLKERLTLTDTALDAGVLRFEIPPTAFESGDLKLYKPTALDGMAQGGADDPMYASTEAGMAWGVTKSANNVKEALMAPVPIGKTKTAFVKGAPDESAAWDTPTEDAAKPTNSGKAAKDTYVLAFQRAFKDKTASVLDEILVKGAKEGEGPAFELFAYSMKQAAWSGDADSINEEWVRFKKHNPQMKFGLDQKAHEGAQVHTYDFKTPPFDGKASDGTKILAKVAGLVKIARLDNQASGAPPTPFTEEDKQGIEEFVNFTAWNTGRIVANDVGVSGLGPELGPKFADASRMHLSAGWAAEPITHILYGGPASAVDAMEDKKADTKKVADSKLGAPVDASKTAVDQTEDDGAFVAPPGAAAPIAFHTQPFKVHNPKIPADKKKREMVVKGTAVLRNKGQTDLTDDEKLQVRNTLGRRWTTVMQTKVSQVGTQAAIDELDKMAIVVMSLSGADLLDAEIELLHLEPEVLLDGEAESSAKAADEDGLLVDQKKEKAVELDYEVKKLDDGRVETTIKTMKLPGGITAKNLVGTAEFGKKDKLRSFEGKGEVSIAFKDAYTIDMVLDSLTMSRGMLGMGDLKLADASGRIRIPFEIPLGEYKGNQWFIAPGATGSGRIANGKLVEVGGGLDMICKDDQGEFMSLSFEGTMPFGNNPQIKKITGAATASLLRDILVFKGMGPKGDWDIYIGHQSNVTVELDKGALAGISGTIHVDIHDAKGPALRLSCDMTVYEHGKKPKLTVTGAGMWTLRDMHVLKAGAFDFFLATGAGAKMDIAENTLQRIHGTIPVEIHDEQGPFTHVSLEGKYEGGAFTGKGGGGLLRDVPLAENKGPRDLWALRALAKKTGFQVAVDNNQITSISGQLDMMLAEQGKDWLQIGGNFTWIKATDMVSGSGSITVIAKTLAGEKEGVEVWIDKGSTATATLKDNDLTKIDGKLCFLVAEGGKPKLGGDLSGMWNGETGMISGQANLAILDDWDIAIPGGSMLLKKGSKGSASMKDSALERITCDKFAAEFAMNVGGREWALELTGSGTYDHTNRKVEKATGDVRLMNVLRVTDKIKVTEISGGASIENNDLTEVHGKLVMEYQDEQGPLISGTLDGSWDAKSNDVSGTAEVKVLRDMRIDVGKSLYIMLYGGKDKGTGGKVTFKGGEFQEIDGDLDASLFRTVTGPEGVKAGEKLASIAAKGVYNIKDSVLVDLSVTVTLEKDFQFLDGGITLDEISVTLVWNNNQLISGTGTAKMFAPVIKVTGAVVTFGWRNDGARDYYSFDAQFWWVFFREKDDQGDDVTLQGMLHVKWNEDDTFWAQAAATYKAGKAFTAAATVEIDSALDPIVREATIEVGLPLLDKQTLFDVNQNLFSLQLRYLILVLNLGIDIGAMLDTQPLTLAGKFSIYNWKPAESTTPDFEAELGMQWGLTLEAYIGAYVEGALDVLIAAAGAGATARLVLRIPIDIGASVSLFSAKDSWGGVFGIDVGIHPELFVRLIPYLFAEVIFFDEIRSEFGPFDFPLASFDGFDWNMDFPFGDTPPKKKAKKDKVNKKTAEVVSEETGGDDVGPKDKGSLKSGPASPEKRTTNNATLPGGTEISGEQMAGGDQKDDGSAESEVDKKMAEIEAVLGGLEALTDFMDYMGSVFRYLSMGPFGVVMLAWEVVAGDLQFSRLAEMWVKVTKALEVVGKFLSEGEPSWGGKAMLGKWLSGEISTWYLLTGADDEVRKAVKEGKHLEPGMTAEGLRGMMETLTSASNWAGEEDEDAILEICRAAKKKGCLNYVIATSAGVYYEGNDQVEYKLSGKQDEEYRKLAKGVVKDDQEYSASLPEKRAWRKKKYTDYPSVVYKWADVLPLTDGMDVLEEYDAYDSPTDKKQRDPTKATKIALNKAYRFAKDAGPFTKAQMKKQGLYIPKDFKG